MLLPEGVLLGLDDGKIIALALETGKTLWESELSFATGRSEIERLVDIDADLLIDERYIYAVNYQGRLARIEPGRGRQTWSIELSSIAGMAQNDAALFITNANDNVVAIDKETGEVLWRQEKLLGRKLSRPAVVGNAIAVADLEGFVHLLSVDDGTLVGRTRATSNRIKAAPLVRADDIIVQSVNAKLRLIRTSQIN